MRLANERAIVTGGASGFGEGIVRRFVAEGVSSLAPQPTLPNAGSDFGLGGEDVAGGPRLHVVVAEAGGDVHAWRPVSATPDPRAVPSSAGIRDGWRG